MVADKFVWGKMILLFITIFYLFPKLQASIIFRCNGSDTRFSQPWGSIAHWLLRTGHLRAFCLLAVGPIPVPYDAQLHVPYPIAMILGGIVGGLWCVLFGLPSARVKGFYPHHDHHGGSIHHR